MDPLAHPTNQELLARFRSGLCTPDDVSPFAQLTSLARAFATIPYENLTKIIKDAEVGSPETACRTPEEVLADHQRWRAGGTCFSLTATLLHLVRSLGFDAEPILADRRYGTNTHCALLVWIDHQPHLLDPGYLIVQPIPLAASLNASAELTVPTPFNQLRLIPTGQDKIELHTVHRQDRRYRLTFKTTPVDETQFRRAWIASFDWDMMHYPLLTKVTAAQQLYMRGSHFQKRSATEVQRDEIPQELLAQRMASEFGIHPELIHKALAVLRRRGD